MIKIRSLASSSQGNCHWVTDGITPLLLDCGIRFNDIRKGVGFKTSELAGALITHEHNDHCRAADKAVKAGIDCYMSQGTANKLDIKSHRIKIVVPKKRFSVGSWLIMPFKTEHDCVDPLGFLLGNQEGENLVYLTDTLYSHYIFNNLTHIMVECNYSLDILNENVRTGKIQEYRRDRIIQTHFGLENVKDFLIANDLSRVQEIHLLHLSDRNSDAERFKREIQELTGKMVFVPG